MDFCHRTWLRRLPAFALISLAALLEPAVEQRRVDDAIRCALEAPQSPDAPQDGQEPGGDGAPGNDGPSLGPQPDVAWDRGAASVACSLELRSLPRWQPEPMLGLGRCWRALPRQDDPSDLLDVNGHNANHPPHGPPPLHA